MRLDKINAKIDMEALNLMDKIEPQPQLQERDAQIAADEMFREASRYLEINAINPDNFVELYGKDAVNADKKKAASLKAKIFENRKISKGLKLATILEAVITENVDNNAWFGRDAEARPTAPFDDCENGIDTLTIFKKEGGFEKYMGLVMDATHNSHEGELRGKFNQIRGEIVRGTLGTMKYFESGKIKGKMSQIPKVVIGVADKTIQDLGKLKAAGRKKEISEHPAQFQILEEIETQLKIFAEYARRQPENFYYEKSGRDLRGELVKTYEDAHSLIADILRQRRMTVRDTGERDEMFDIIRSETKKLLKRNRN